MQFQKKTTTIFCNLHTQILTLLWKINMSTRWLSLSTSWLSSVYELTKILSTSWPKCLRVGLSTSRTVYELTKIRNKQIIKRLAFKKSTTIMCLINYKAVNWGWLKRFYSVSVVNVIYFKRKIMHVYSTMKL